MIKIEIKECISLIRKKNDIINFENFKMKDPFQTIYPEQSRIDRILISNHLITKINTIEHKIKLSDHRTVELHINFTKKHLQ